MWTALKDLIGSSLAFFYDLIPNYGVAIILLTVVISVILFPLTLKQTRSMKAMQEIQPEVKRLQKEHKGDRETLNKALMDLYKERGVNPAAGCFPLLLQMPIWFALFQALRGIAKHVPVDSDLSGAVSAGRTNFLGMDLLISPSEALSDFGFVEGIPYLIAIIVVVATAYYQQRQTTARQDDQGQQQTPQQETMQRVMKIFPFFFGFISFSLVSGLVLYFAVSQIFRIGQQAYILRLDGDKAPAAAAGTKGSAASAVDSQPGELGPEDPGGSDGGAQPQSKKSYQGSKKRKRRRRRK